MIRANELRIGNWVKYHDDDTLFKVVEIDTLGIRVENEEQNTWIEYDCFSPIPLTPEILEKCGFEFRDDGTSNRYYIGENKITMDWLFSIVWINWHKHPFYMNGRHEIKYLHQLQNLYFALTGEELIYTP